MDQPPVCTGLDRLLLPGAARLASGRAGLLLHPASVTRDLLRAPEALLAAGFRLEALFGPQHGARGEKQDNMVESDHYRDPQTGLPVYSLYGATRRPTPDMLDGLDVLLFDLQDVGVRAYTFVSTMSLAMESCAEAGVRFVVLDRPNPLGGVIREGPLLEPGFESFIGLHPIPLRHGLTCGELARWLVTERGIDVELEVVTLEGWRRTMTWEETGLPWVLPSPNLPTVDSCRVYPGTVLVEGTNLSEGRGTTRPFELVGAPFLVGWELAERLSDQGLEGVSFRPCSFEPTFDKHAGRLCGGVQVHVTDEDAFRPVRTGVAMLQAARELAPHHFAWRSPPFEYEEKLVPVDILWGSDRLRLGIERGASVDAILAGVEAQLDAFERGLADSLLY